MKKNGKCVVVGMVWALLFAAMFAVSFIACRAESDDILIVIETESLDEDENSGILVVMETEDTNKNAEDVSAENVNSVETGTEDTDMGENTENEEGSGNKAAESGNVLMCDSAGSYYFDGAMTVIENDIFSLTVLGSEYSRDMICSVTFLDTLDDMPENAWDVSAESNGSVMAWAVENGSYYDLYIAGNGGVDANPDSSFLFANYSKMKTIEFNSCFYTGNATTLAGTFAECDSLQTIDLSSFITSNVTDMNELFYDDQKLISINLEGLDTSRVTGMRGMFDCNRKVTTLDISSFDTSNVTTMHSMFAGCNSLVNVALDSFDTSNVTDMS
ncbi:MAG: DUF285 domain-containing protein, partial [Clostridiales bacterium]|nr:DUF285 domain-containing protein [Clostridiales bacterium]